MHEIIHYLDEAENDLYQDWLDSLRDRVAKLAIIKRVARMEVGLFGDCKPLRDQTKRTPTLVERFFKPNRPLTLTQQARAAMVFTIKGLGTGRTAMCPIASCRSARACPLRSGS